MLSADVPEFIPKAQRGKQNSDNSPVHVSHELEVHIQAAATAATTSTNAVVSPNLDAGNATSDPINCSPNPPSHNVPPVASDDADRAAASGGRSVPAGVHPDADADNGGSIAAADAPAGAAAVASASEAGALIENKYPDSKLSATVDPFIPRHLIEYNSGDASNSHMYDAASNYPLFPRPPAHYFYSTWSTDMDYGTTYYDPMANPNQYSGEYYVPDGGVVFDEVYGHAPGNVAMDQVYCDYGMAGPDYSAGAAALAVGSQSFGRGGKSGNGNYNRRKDSNRGGRGRGRGGNVGPRSSSGKQPATEFGICSQTGELTLKKGSSKPQISQNKNEDESPAVQVKASSIINNANNWPSLADKSKPEQNNSSAPVTPLVPVSAAAPVAQQKSTEPRQKSPTLPNGPAPTSPPSAAGISFSSIAAKKKSGYEEFVPDKPARQEPKLAKQKPAPSTTAHKRVSVSSDSKEQDTVSVNSVPAPADVASPTADETQVDGARSIMSKSAKKKAKKKLKKAQLSVEASNEPEKTSTSDKVENTTAVETPAPVELPAKAPTPAAPVQTLAALLCSDSKKFTSTPTSNGAAAAKNVTENGKKSPKKNKGSSTKPEANGTTENKSSTNKVDRSKVLSQNRTISESSNPTPNNISRSPSEEVEEKDATPKEDEWITVTKRSKVKKSVPNRDSERSSNTLGFRQTNGNGVNFRGPQFGRSKRNEGKSMPSKENKMNGQQVSKEEPSERLSLPNGNQSTETLHVNGCIKNGNVEINGIQHEPPPDPKPKDPDDPEFKEKMQRRALKKEAIKQEKKINREAAALQKQAAASKTSKLSILSTSQVSNYKDSAKTGFVMNNQEYPSLGNGKKAKVNGEPPKNSTRKVSGMRQTLAPAVDLPIPEARTINKDSGLKKSCKDTIGGTCSGSELSVGSKSKAKAGYASAAASAPHVNLDKNVNVPATNNTAALVNIKTSAKKKKTKQTSAAPTPSKKSVKSSDKIVLNLDSLIKVSFPHLMIIF